MKKTRKMHCRFLHMGMLLWIYATTVTACSKQDEVIFAESSSGWETEPFEEGISSAKVEELQQSDVPEATTTSDSTYQPAEQVIFVHVCGAVRYSGVYELAPNSRVMDAITAAGGMTESADEEYVNLATILSDGDKVRIPTKEEVASMLKTENDIGVTSYQAAEIPGTNTESTARININTAGVEELCTLPGIGQTRAESIVEYRTKHGAFQSIEDIMSVSGIKESSFQKIKDRITV